LLHSAQILTTVLNLVVLVVIITNRDAFRGETDRGSVALAAPRLATAALGAVTASTVLSIVLGRLAWGIEWWRAFLASAQRLIGITSLPLPDRVDDFAAPTLLTVGVVIVVGTLYLITRPVVDRRMSQHAFSQRERRLAELRARDIVRRHGRGTLDYFALRDDKQFFFFHDSLVAYAVYGGVALISPDPIGPATERAGVLASFQRFAEQRGWTIAVIGASEEWLPFYQAVGLHQIYVGDEAVVNCQTFSLDGGKMKGLRQACTRLARNGYTVEFVDPATISRDRVAGIVDLMGKLRRGEGERGFSMMLGRMFHPRDRGLLLTIVSAPDGSPAAICQFVPSPAINGYSLDLMRRDPDEHPNGLIDYALCSTIAHLREQGARGLSLNFAAFRSVLDGEKGDGTFTKVERWALRRLSGILPIETLWSFNAKYLPDWQPRYLIYPGVENLVPVVAAVLRAESLTEIPVFGRFLSNDPVNRPGTVVPEELLAESVRPSA
jgi:lysyl-tRNA synthetase class 2